MLSSDEIFGELRCQILTGLSRAQLKHYLSTANNWVKFRHFFESARKEEKKIN